jgi:murein DD-endopeptidase MepM/ murein hydrolase activator NlpD
MRRQWCLAALCVVTAVAPARAQTVAVRARALRAGEVVRVTVTAADPPVSVRAFDREWPVFADGDRWNALVGIDLDRKPGSYDLVVATSRGVMHRALTVQPHAFPTRRLTVDPDLVHPPPAMQERIEREARELHDLWEHSAPQRLWTAPFTRPVPDPANSAFGTRSVYNGEARSPHAGADFLSPAGRPIAAPNDGRVVLAAPLYFTGNTVIIDHGAGLFSLLAHLSVVDVHAGEAVSAGQIVGKVGATGRVTGPHLHWTVRLNNARVDPLSLLYATDAERQAPRRPGPSVRPPFR